MQRRRHETVDLTHVVRRSYASTVPPGGTDGWEDPDVGAVRTDGVRDLSFGEKVRGVPCPGVLLSSDGGTGPGSLPLKPGKDNIKRVRDCKEKGWKFRVYQGVLRT